MGCSRAPGAKLAALGAPGQSCAPSRSTRHHRRRSTHALARRGPQSLERPGLLASRSSRPAPAASSPLGRRRWTMPVPAPRHAVSHHRLVEAQGPAAAVLKNPRCPCSAAPSFPFLTFTFSPAALLVAPERPYGSLLPPLLLFFVFFPCQPRCAGATTTSLTIVLFFFLLCDRLPRLVPLSSLPGRCILSFSSKYGSPSLRRG